MASYPVALTEVGTHKKLTIASTVDTVVFSRNCQNVEVISDGAADLYFTTDGTIPTIAGNGTHRLPTGIQSAYTQAIAAHGSGGNVTVSLISSGAVTYSVTGDGATA